MQEQISSSRGSNLIFILLLLIDLFLLTAHLNIYVKTLKNFLFYIVSPVPAAAEKVIETGGQVWSNIRNIVYVNEENASLRKSLERYSYLEKEYVAAMEENERLKSIVGIDFPSKKRAVVSRVIAREPSSWYEWIIIDKGVENGLFADAPVLTWAGNKLVVIGRVWEVYAKKSKIILITNTLCAIPVEIRNKREDGLIEGQNNGILKLNYLLPESSAKLQDEVVTSPISQVFPPGVTIGYVRDVLGSSRNNTMKIATVTPAFNSVSLKIVEVLVPKEKTGHE